MPRRKSPRLNSLTSLRYYAAIAVVITHVNPYYLTSSTQKAAVAYWYVGVAFFYMLSGFVLTWSCSSQTAKEFWWNRFSRIFPLQLTMMVVAYVVLWKEELHPGGALGWILQLFLLQAWDPATNVHSGGNGPTWSLSCEAFFYAMFPLIILGVRRMRMRGVTVSAACVLATMALVPVFVGPHVSSATYLWTFFYLPAYRIGEFICGMLLARAVALGLRFRRPSVGYLLGWLCFAAWVVIGTRYALHHHFNEISRPFVTLLVLPAFALLLVAGASADLSGRTRLMGAWLPVKLGEWSFALYMVHDPIVTLVTHHHWLGPSGGAGYLALFVVLCTAVAVVAHYALEKPAERYLRTRRSTRAKRPPSPTAGSTTGDADSDSIVGYHPGEATEPLNLGVGAHTRSSLYADSANMDRQVVFTPRKKGRHERT